MVNRTPAEKEWSRLWYQNNKERICKKLRMRRYGLGPEAYDAMLIVQNRKCAACQDELTISSKIHVDHCHKTGRLRELLCEKCNLALGCVRDSIKRLQNLIVYLKKHNYTTDKKYETQAIQERKGKLFEVKA